MSRFQNRFQCSIILIMVLFISLFDVKGQTHRINFTQIAPQIDGTIDNSWSVFDAAEIDNHNQGLVSSSKDLSGYFKTSFDDQNIYLLVVIKDDVFHTDNETNVWNDDGLEIFIDADNSKSGSFGANDFQFQFRYNDSEVHEAVHGNVTGVTTFQRTSNDSVFYEISIPIDLLGLEGPNIENDQLIGFDIHINDDDEGNREGKLAWYARKDQSSSNTAYFGTAKFDGRMVAPKAEKPDFSHKRGVYEEPFELSISSIHTDANIVYTLDGSDPRFSESAISGVAPALININPVDETNRGGVTPAVVVRALVEAPGFSGSKVKTHSFIFVNEVIGQSDPGGHWQNPYANFGWPGLGNPQNIDYEMSPSITEASAYKDLMDDALTSIPSYSLVTEYDDMFGSTKGIFMNALEDGWERPVSVEMIDPVSQEDFQIDAGVRIRGRYSRLPRNGKHSFRLMFRNEYGDKKLKFPIFGEEGTDEFKRLDFRTAQNSSWQTEESHSTVTFLKEVVARDMQGQMGMDYTKSLYCHLYLNGMYWGMFQIQERADENFGETYIGGDKDDYDIIKPRKNVPVPEEDLKIGAIAGNTESAERLWDHILAGVSSNEDYFSIQGMNQDGSVNESFERLLDVENLIDYLLISFYVGSLDGPGVTWEGLWGHTVRPNNFIGIYNRNNPDGFKWIVHDFEKTMYDSDEDFPLLEQDDTWFSEDFQFFNPITLHRKLMENEEYRVKLADRVHRHYEKQGVFTSNKVRERFDLRKSQIQLAVIAEAARWGNTISWLPENTPQNWEDNVNWLFENYIPVRTNVVLSQFDDLGVRSDLHPPSITYDEEELLGESEIIIKGDEITLTDPNGEVDGMYYTLDGSDPRLIGGAVSTLATMATTSVSISIDQITVLKTRIKSGEQWSPLLEMELNLDDNYDNFKITEIHYNPLDGDDYEFMEFKNTGSDDLNLTGLSISGGIQFDFGKLILPSGDFVVLASDSVAFKALYNLNASGQYIGQLKNSGELFELNNSAGRTVMSIEYHDEAPWSISPDGLGNSLVVMEESMIDDPSDAAYWRASSKINGSPFSDDEVSVISPVIINEVLANAEDPLVDQIELYNPSTDPLDIGYWFLTDDKDEPQKWQIPEGSAIDGQGYLVFLNGHYVDGVLVYDLGEFGSAFSLSSHGESLYLLSGNSEGELTGYSTGVKFGEEESGVSFGVTENSQGDSFFVAMSEKTFGDPNSLPKVGPVIFSEIMYHPSEGFPEYVTLKNISDEQVSLYAEDEESNTWKVEGLSFQFPTDTKLAAGEELYIIEDTVSLDRFRDLLALIPSTQIFNMEGKLDNSGENLGLYKPGPSYEKNDIVQFEYILIESVRYNDKAPWPLEADGLGASLVRTETNEFANDPVAWASQNYETPPMLHPDMVNTSAENDVMITFDDNSDWRESIYEITIEGQVLDVEDYIINSGSIELVGSLFQFKKDYAVTVIAKGYFPTTVTQSILTGPVLRLDLTYAKAVTVFPNPFQGLITINLENSYSNASVVIFDLSGRKVSEVENFVGQLKLELTNQPSGLYVIKVSNDNSQTTRLVMKQ